MSSHDIFHGLQHASVSFVLLRCGVKLLEECKKHGCVTSDERYLLEKYIGPLFDRLLASRCTVGFLGEAFLISAEQHNDQTNGARIDMPLVPQTFENLLEARNSLKRILDWAHDSFPCQSSPDPPSGYGFEHRLQSLKDAWLISAAISSFSRTDQSTKTLKTLQAACIIGTIIVRTARYNEESSFDKQLGDFEQSVILLEQAWPSTHNFGIDAALMDMTAFLGTKCRDPGIRRRALALLRRQDWTEADRVVKNAATTLEALISLEERDSRFDTFHDLAKKQRQVSALGEDQMSASGMTPDRSDVKSCRDIPEANRKRWIRREILADGRLDLFYSSPDGTQRDKCRVLLSGGSYSADERLAKMRREAKDDAATPVDAIAAPGYSAYRENGQGDSYFQLQLERFHFPIPKV